MADQVRRHEPFPQISAGFMKNRAARDRVLMTAFGALKDAWSRRQMVCFGILALVASKAFRPPEAGKCLNATILISIFVAERKEARHIHLHMAWRLSRNWISSTNSSENFRLISIYFSNHRLQVFWLPALTG